MTALPMKTRLELDIEEVRQAYMFLCVEFQAINREIDEFNTEISKTKKKDGLTHNTKIIPKNYTSVPIEQLTSPAQDLAGIACNCDWPGHPVKELPFASSAGRGDGVERGEVAWGCEW